MWSIICLEYWVDKRLFWIRDYIPIIITTTKGKEIRFSWTINNGIEKIWWWRHLNIFGINLFECIRIKNKIVLWRITRLSIEIYLRNKREVWWISKTYEFTCLMFNWVILFKFIEIIHRLNKFEEAFEFANKLQ